MTDVHKMDSILTAPISAKDAKDLRASGHSMSMIYPSRKEYISGVKGILILEDAPFTDHV